MDWSETIVDKGIVPKNSTISHKFIYSGDKEIKKILPLCSCIKTTIHHPEYSFRLKAKNNTNTNKQTSKMIEVHYKDGTRSFLIIKATITNETK